MPKRERLNYENLREDLFRLLTARGASSANALCESLGVSQPTLSRLLSSAENRIVRAGKASQTLYALRAPLPTGHDAIPVFTIDEKGQTAQVATLRAIAPKGYYLESASTTIASRFYGGLPYFFEDLRPAGFLGRLVPRLHPDLAAPNDIRDWNDENCLAYWMGYGWDLVGNFIIGERAYDAYVENLHAQPDAIPMEVRAERYPPLAERVMTTGVPGSSAGGEQAKFLAVCVSGRGPQPVLVKFSPPKEDKIGRRIADLLACEHVAHETLRSHGIAAAQSELLEAGGRTFLQMDRFDRTRGGRKGLISLLPLDMEFVGQARTWSETAKGLHAQKKIDDPTYRAIAWLDVFGRLIANTDRHLGNVSLFADGERLLGLAPVYDMLPMLYAPQQNQLVERTFEPEPPRLAEAPVWAAALTAALDFWGRIQAHPLVSDDFKTLTSENAAKLSRLSALTALLPR